MSGLVSEMWSGKYISLKARLVLLTLLSSGIGLAVALSAFLVLETRTARENKLEDLHSAADLIGTDSAAALLFRDPTAGTRVLQALKTRKAIRRGILYNADGTVLAKFQQVNADLPVLPNNDPEVEHTEWTSDYVAFRRPIFLEDRMIGSLYIESDLEELHSETRAAAGLAAPVFAVTLLLIAILTLQLQKSIIGPIRHLASTVRLVAFEKNYRLRATSAGSPELHQLSADFNHMLEEIEIRDNALREAKELLEERVNERTLALEQEIAERQHAETMLKQSEELFRALNEASPVGIISEGKDGLVRQCNPQFRRMFGFDSQDWIGKSLDDLVAPTDSLSTARELSKAVISGQVVHRITKRRKKDGSLLDVEVFGAPLLVDGRPQGQLGVYLDISQRVANEAALRQSEELFRTLSVAAPIGIFRCDTEGRFTYVNHRWAELAGRRVEDALGFGWADAIHPEERETVRKAWQAGIHMGIEMQSETRLLTPDGETNWIFWQARPMHAADGTLTGFVGVIEDINKRRAAEQRLLDAKSSAEQASAAKSQFLANVSHEIRTPLNGILGMTELALETEMSAEQREYLGMVKGCGESLLEIIDDVLDFSKIENGKLELESISFSLLDCVERAMQPVLIRAQQKRIALEWTVRGDLPSWVVGDSTRLRQVLINLLGNAVKFTPTGEVTLTLECLENDAQYTKIGFAVSDTGIGIPAENQILIFEAFRQSDSTVTREFGGTGLGLSISARLVKAMGGEITVESRSGQGSVFRFTLPFVRSNSPAPQQWPQDALNTLPAAKVLLVEGSAATCELETWLMKRWGLEVDVARNGGEARSLLARSLAAGERYRIALLDQNLPGVDVYELVKQIRGAASPEITSIVLNASTAVFTEDARDNGYGIFRRITKPVRHALLWQTLHAALTGDRRPTPTGAPQLSGHSVRSRDILLVEDNLVNQKLAVRVLEKMRHRVTLVGNGAEACEILRDRNFDLVLMDLQMPIMGGVQATERIRAREAGGTRHLPIVAMTAHAAPEDERRCLEVGMDGYLSKPIRREVLAEEIERVCEDNPQQTAEAPVGAKRELPAQDWNLIDLLDRVEGDRQFMRELLSMFRGDSKATMESARGALAIRDLPALSRAAHTMKGMLRNLAMGSSAEIASLLEVAARSESFDDSRELFARLEQAIGRILPEVEAQIMEVQL